MFIKGLKCLLALWLVACWSAAATAVPLNSLPVTISGDLNATDFTSQARGAIYYADRYEVAVTPGQQLTINLSTVAYDGYLYLNNAQGVTVATNDDFGSIYASRIVYTATVAETLTIETTTYSSYMTGSYTLDVQSVGGSSSPSTAAQLVIPSTVTGTLGASSSRGLTQTLNPADRYQANLQAGQTITINETAPFDTYLNLYDSTGVRVAFNDDFNGLNSQVQYTVPTSGIYTVEATSYSSAATGSYNLTIASATATASTITASFSASPSSGTAPVNVSMWNTSYSSNATDVLNYSWDFGDGTTSTSPSPTHTYSSGGNYTITLTVTNGAGQSNASSSTVTVQAPAAQVDASFLPSVASPLANTAVVFYYTGSSSIFSTLSYAWNFGDGQTSQLQNPSHTFLYAGTYQVSLTVTDQAWQSATTTQSITVQPGTGNFTAAFRPSNTTLMTGETATFVNQSISQTAGEVLAYSWNFGDGTTSTSSDPTHAYTTAGTFVVRLTATNSLGISSSYSQTVTVQQANSTLAALFTANATIGAAPLAVTFTNQSTSSLLGDSLTYSWNFGDGTTSTVASPSQTYTAAGTYAVTLTVRNMSGQTVTSSATNITVSQGSSVNVTGVVRLRPQVIMAGFDPILVDLADTSFKLFNVVRPGAVPIQTVQTANNSGGFSTAMTYAGTYSSGDQRYETTYTFPRGSFPSNSILGDLFGSAASQFRMTVVDSAQQIHSFPHLEFGNNVLMTMPITSPSAPTSTTAGTKRLLPQVLAAGLDPMLIDLGDTSFDIVAIVRPGVVPVGSVSVSQNQGGFSMAMSLVETLPNSDEKYKITFTYQRGAFPETRMADLFGTQRGQFNIIVTDQAQQTHHFPELRVGNYPAM